MVRALPENIPSAFSVKGLVGVCWSDGRRAFLRREKCVCNGIKAGSHLAQLGACKYFTWLEFRIFVEMWLEIESFHK